MVSIGRGSHRNRCDGPFGWGDLVDVYGETGSDPVAAVLILAARWVSPKGHTSLESALVSYSRRVESDSALAWRCSTACSAPCGAAVRGSRTSAGERTADIPWRMSA